MNNSKTGSKTNNWVFLRGLTRGNIHWGKFPEEFKKLNPDCDLVFLEIPGNGSLNNEETPITAKTVIDLLRARCKFTLENESFHVCGISLGGMIALKWAELYPEEIRSVTTINTSLNQFSPFYQRLEIFNYGKIIWGLFACDASEQERIILKITSNHFAKAESYLESFVAFSKNHQVSKTNFVKQLLLANNIKIKNIASISLKVISSKKDRLVDSTCSDKIAKAFKGKQFIHPTAGHDLPLDEPIWLAEKLLAN